MKHLPIDELLAYADDQRAERKLESAEERIARKIFPDGITLICACTTIRGEPHTFGYLSSEECAGCLTTGWPNQCMHGNALATMLGSKRLADQKMDWIRAEVL